MTKQRPNLRAAQAFVAVVEVGSFHGGATQLDLDPSSVSKLVATLEGYLGVTLFQRTTRSVCLTAAGRRALDAARALLTASEAFTRATHRAQESGDGCARRNPTSTPTRRAVAQG